MSCVDRLASRKFECIYLVNWIGVRSCLTTKTRQNKTTEHLAGCFSCRFDDLEMLLAMNS